MVIFNFSVDIILLFIFELEVNSSDPMARCGHGQNLTMTSESDVTNNGHCHGNVSVELARGLLK